MDWGKSGNDVNKVHVRRLSYPDATTEQKGRD
jgi:hypothetical protein